MFRSHKGYVAIHLHGNKGVARDATSDMSTCSLFFTNDAVKNIITLTKKLDFRVIIIQDIDLLLT